MMNTMNGVGIGPQDELDDDTVELDLSPEQIQALHDAARECCDSAPLEGSGVPAQERSVPSASGTPGGTALDAIASPARPEPDGAMEGSALHAPPMTVAGPRSRCGTAAPSTAAARVPAPRGRLPAWPLLLASPCVGALVPLLFMNPPVSPVTTTAPTARIASTPARAPRGQPVRVENPFDSSEIFEFPPGTHEQWARAEVARRLLARANDRQDESLLPVATGSAAEPASPGQEPQGQGADAAPAAPEDSPSPGARAE